MVILNGQRILTNREAFNLMFPNYERYKMIKLEDGKTYLSKDGQRIKVKKNNDVLFEGDNGLEYMENGQFIMCPYSCADLIKETDGTIKHLYKKAKNILMAVVNKIEGKKN